MLNLFIKENVSFSLFSVLQNLMIFCIAYTLISQKSWIFLRLGRIHWKCLDFWWVLCVACLPIDYQDLNLSKTSTGVFFLHDINVISGHLLSCLFVFFTLLVLGFPWYPIDCFELGNMTRQDFDIIALQHSLLCFIPTSDFESP